MAALRWRSTALATIVYAVVALLCLGSALVSAAEAVPDVEELPAGTNCSQPRIRKSWDAFTDEEKNLYFCALSQAMDTGLHQKFVELHTEALSEAEAHQTCVFIYWHRMYLLGYENMLRSLAPEYRCITMPYWDHLSATAKFASGECGSLEDCSRIITEFGGSTRGYIKELDVYGTTTPVVMQSTQTTSTTQIINMCVNQGVLSHFCGNNTKCAHCIPRGRGLRSKRYPSEAFFGSVYQQVFAYDDSISFTKAVERGVHNMIHGQMGGIMTTLQSPIDPIFYTHHAMVDLLQTIYLKCQNGAEGVFLSDTTKNTDRRFWGSCRRRTTGRFLSSDRIMMRTRGFDGAWVHVREDPNNLLYAYFKDLPATYAEYVDAKDLGVYSYTYEISGGLTNMYDNCKNSVTLSAATLMAREERLSGAESGDSLVPVVEGATAVDDKTRRWAIAIFESARLTGYTETAAKEQMEMIICQHQEECLGGAEDYTDVFRESFGVEGHTRCFTVVQELASGDRVIGIPEWRNITSRFVPCPQPKVSTEAVGSTQVA